MAGVKRQIEVKPREKQNIPPVLQTFLQKQHEASEDSHDPDAANEAAGSTVQNKTKPATPGRGNMINEPANLNVVETRRGLANSPNPYRPGQGTVPAASTFQKNITQQQDATNKKPASSTTKSYIKMTNQSSSQHQVTKQSTNSNVVDKVPQTSSQVNETKSKPFNQFSPKSSNTTDSSTSSSSSSSPATLPTPSPSSHDDGVVIDFRSALRPTRNSVLSELFEKSTSTLTTAPTRVLTGSSKLVEASSSSPSPSSPSSSSSSPSSSSSSAVGLQTTRASPKSSGPAWPPQPATARGQSSPSQLQGGITQNVVKPGTPGEGGVVTRTSDHRQFRRISPHVLATNLPAPPTHPLPNIVDLTEVRQKYHSLLGNLLKSPNGTYVTDVVQAKSGDNKRSERQSLIKEISAEEEDEAVYDEGYSMPPPLAAGQEELYTDGFSEKQADGGKDEDIYEEAVLLVDAQEAKATRLQLREQADARKREEKERKEKEKEEKKRLKEDEKMRVKKEKELIQQQKLFNLTGREVMVGDGVMKQDFKDMSLREGQTVTIVRLDRNPPNMWLIKTEAGFGYVSSGLIEVEPLVIRQAMNNIRKSLDEHEDDSIYVDVDMK